MATPNSKSSTSASESKDVRIVLNEYGEVVRIYPAEPSWEDRREADRLAAERAEAAFDEWVDSLGI